MVKLLLRIISNDALEALAIDTIFRLIDQSVKNPDSRKQYSSILAKIKEEIESLDR